MGEQRPQAPAALRLGVEVSTKYGFALEIPCFVTCTGALEGPSGPFGSGEVRFFFISFSPSLTPAENTVIFLSTMRTYPPHYAFTGGFRCG